MKKRIQTEKELEPPRRLLAGRYGQANNKPQIKKIMIENWDRFPSNFAEMLGPIERKSFTFKYRRFEVWQGGSCIYRGDSNGQIIAKVVNENLQVTVDDIMINTHINKQFSFREISTNGDRIMWSKDIFNTSEKVEYNNPDISSLFFKNGVLTKVTYTIHNPNTLVEFYS